MDTATASNTIPFVDLATTHAQIREDLGGALMRVLDEGGFTLGTEVERLEREFAHFVDCRYGVGVGSGTDALHLALRACGVGWGDAVITVPNTFAATVEAIAMTGAQPLFVDIDPQTYLMDVSRLEAAVTPQTKAIVPVHLYGQTVDMAGVRAVADKYGLAVIEDACQAHGARSEGRAAGSLGDAGCFSFYPSKNLGALGDGGMVTTNDPDIAERVRLLRNHGEDGDRSHLVCGYCSRLHGLQAAALRVKLPRLEEWNANRGSAALAYGTALAVSNLILPATRPGSTHVYHLYVVRSKDRDRLRTHLASRGIQTGIHYPVPLHLEPAFNWLGYGPGDMPVAEHVQAQIVSLPMHPHLTAEDIGRVAEAVQEVSYAQ